MIMASTLSEAKGKIIKYWSRQLHARPAHYLQHSGHRHLHHNEHTASVASFNSGLLNTSPFSYVMETNVYCFAC